MVNNGKVELEIWTHDEWEQKWRGLDLKSSIRTRTATGENKKNEQRKNWWQNAARQWCVDVCWGDVKQDNKENFSLTHFLIECKQTEKKSLSVKGEWLAKITREAMAW